MSYVQNKIIALSQQIERHMFRTTTMWWSSPEMCGNLCPLYILSIREDKTIIGFMRAINNTGEIWGDRNCFTFAFTLLFNSILNKVCKCSEKKVFIINNVYSNFLLRYCGLHFLIWKFERHFNSYLFN